MRSAPEALFVCVAVALSAPVVTSFAQEPKAAPAVSPSPTPSPSPIPSLSPSPSPTPRYRLIPYGFETEQQRSTVPLLRFEDQSEVRALEMNEAIARFFDNKDENGDMTRGATPGTGSAPSLAEMAPYRPHVSPALDFLGLAKGIAQLGAGVVKRKYTSRVERNEELLRALLLRTAASPTPAPSPGASPTPSPSPLPPLMR